MAIFSNNISSTSCKWSSLNAPGSENYRCHPIVWSASFSFMLTCAFVTRVSRVAPGEGLEQQPAPPWQFRVRVDGPTGTQPQAWPRGAGRALATHDKPHKCRGRPLQKLALHCCQTLSRAQTPGQHGRGRDKSAHRFGVARGQSVPVCPHGNSFSSTR